jgi:FtsP/CotA-like multicopper oxidase with cupredoxin domain
VTLCDANRRFCWIPAASAAIAAALILSQVSPASAQQKNRRQAVNPGQFISCAQTGQPLIRIPELVANEQEKVLHGTILLTDTAQRVDLGIGGGNCVPQFMRNFQGINAVLPAYPGMIPPGYPGAVPPPPPTQYVDPVPGPTLRARVGDIVQLTFLNQINLADYGDSIDRGERGQGCDESTAPYPGRDTFPDCFHGSSTGNIHFHGTHANPDTTGDDVFIEVRPSVTGPGGPLVAEPIVRSAFDKFFAECKTQLDKSVLSQWPQSWSDFPPEIVVQQLAWLAQYDADPAIKDKLLPVDLKQWAQGAWPQYYIGAFPYCFRLPEYKEKTWPPAAPARPSVHNVMMEHAEPPLIMGQSPGTHWYHAHKHGSTTLDVENGMTGAFIIEGGYDDALNNFYSQSWTRSQPVLVVNQLGTGVNLFAGGTARTFSVNGRIEPVIAMRPGEVQLWRIVNTSARGGVFISGFAAHNTTVPLSPQPFTWKQTAQDGVQFKGVNYDKSKNPNLLISPGNRADFLVQAPTAPGQYDLLVIEARSRCETLPANQVPTIPTVQPPAGAEMPPYPKPPYPTPICGSIVEGVLQDPVLTPLLTVNVTGTPAGGNQALFIPSGQLQASFPPFLQDIGDDEVNGTKIVVFESHPTVGGGPPFAMHEINGQKFDGNVGAVVLLNAVEEWKIVNNTVNGGVQIIDGKPVVVKTDPPGVVDHPFHIHVNPFQIVEFFDPNQVLPGTNTYKYVFIQSGQQPPNLFTGQCLLYYDKPDTWKPCDSGPKTDLIWWDVFAIPSARAVFINNNTQSVTVPGYFKMRSRFVDYAGQYVMHCHILAHEDRGMMTVVEVVPFTTPYSHQ